MERQQITTGGGTSARGQFQSARAHSQHAQLGARGGGYDAPNGSGLLALSGQRTAMGLGLFSIGLGLVQVAAPGALARWVTGADPRRRRTAMFAVGLRELAAGVGILRQPRKPLWLWTRVAGDVMDLALLGWALGARRSKATRVTGALAAVLGVTALDIFTGRRLSQHKRRAENELYVVRSITINRGPEEVYRFWRDFKNLPRFMAHLESVEVQANQSRWRAIGPAGHTFEWNAEIIEDKPNERLAWQSLPDSEVPNRGEVTFRKAPGGRGTEVHVKIEYEPPAGVLGATIAKLFGREPSQQVAGDLRRLKQVMETGEVVHSDASVHPSMHPARPPQAPSTEATLAATPPGPTPRGRI
jgi:uncharacterized membrane protein